MQCLLSINYLLIHGFLEYKALDQNTVLSVLINTLNGFQAFHDGFCLFGFVQWPQEDQRIKAKMSGRRLIKTSHIVKTTLSFIVKTLTSYSIRIFH